MPGAGCCQALASDTETGGASFGSVCLSLNKFCFSSWLFADTCGAHAKLLSVRMVDNGWVLGHLLSGVGCFLEGHEH